MNSNRFPEIWRSIVAIILLSTLVTACQLGKCSNKLLNKVMGIVPVAGRQDTIKDWSETFFVAFQNAKESTFSWDIQPRSDYGCVVTLSGDVNGINTEGYVWFVDLEENRVYPDDSNAQELVKGWVQGSGDYDLLEGIPLP